MKIFIINSIKTLKYVCYNVAGEGVYVNYIKSFQVRDTDIDIIILILIIIIIITSKVGERLFIPEI